MFDWPEDPLDRDDFTEAADKAALASLAEVAQLGKLSGAEEREEEGEEDEQENELRPPLVADATVSGDVAAPTTPPMGSRDAPAACGTYEESDNVVEGALDAPQTPPGVSTAKKQETNGSDEVVLLAVKHGGEAGQENDSDDLVDLVEVEVDAPVDPGGTEGESEDEESSQVNDDTDEEDIALPCTPLPAPMTPSPGKGPKEAGPDSEDAAVDPGDDWFAEAERNVDTAAAGRRLNGTRPASAADLDASGAAKRLKSIELEPAKVNDADLDASGATKVLKSIHAKPEPTKDLSRKDVDAEDETDCLYPEGF